MTSPDVDLPQQGFPPTLREVMLRPRWIALLALCLVVAGVFSVLLQWQLSRSFDTDGVPEGVTEEVRPLDEVVEPGDYLDGPYVGQRVTTAGSWDPDDFVLVTDRYNDGAEGFWVTGRFVTGDGASLAVALGWTADRDDAERAMADLAAAADGDETPLTGRLISDEGPRPPEGDDVFAVERMSPAALLSHWTGVDGPVYRQFVTSDDPTGGIADAGLDAIASPAPPSEGTINWLNLFYAVEWAIFAGFSFYLWYRLARDAWEKEVDAFHGVAADEDDLDDEL
ncbi:SURF1 family protein [Microbacterium sp. gxy059]|uniref:SURF1 family protein n=1 Tax=Microbacterium sp. gxy059 TaxID=2957199 RepID=UPI003D9667C0